MCSHEWKTPLQNSQQWDLCSDKRENTDPSSFLMECRLYALVTTHQDERQRRTEDIWQVMSLLHTLSRAVPHSQLWTADGGCLFVIIHWWRTLLSLTSNQVAACFIYFIIILRLIYQIKAFLLLFKGLDLYSWKQFWCFSRKLGEWQVHVAHLFTFGWSKESFHNVANGGCLFGGLCAIRRQLTC